MSRLHRLLKNLFPGQSCVRAWLRSPRRPEELDFTPSRVRARLQSCR